MIAKEQSIEVGDAMKWILGQVVALCGGGRSQGVDGCSLCVAISSK